MKKKALAIKKDEPGSPVINRVQKVGKIPVVPIRATGFNPRLVTRSSPGRHSEISSRELHWSELTGCTHRATNHKIIEP
jgi:hypothetical protein